MARHTIDQHWLQADNLGNMPHSKLVHTLAVQGLNTHYVSNFVFSLCIARSHCKVDALQPWVISVHHVNWCCCRWITILWCHIIPVDHFWDLLGRSNSQRELNAFLFQAELPLPFWPLLLWVLMWTHETEARLCDAQTKDDFKFLENKYGLNLPFPRGSCDTQLSPYWYMYCVPSNMCLSL